MDMYGTLSIDEMQETLLLDSRVVECEDVVY
jgi:hypothetical protein